MGKGTVRRRGERKKGKRRGVEKGKRELKWKLERREGRKGREWKGRVGKG